MYPVINEAVRRNENPIAAKTNEVIATSFKADGILGMSRMLDKCPMNCKMMWNDIPALSEINGYTGYMKRSSLCG